MVANAIHKVCVCVCVSCSLIQCQPFVSISFFSCIIPDSGREREGEKIENSLISVGGPAENVVLCAAHISRKAAKSVATLVHGVRVFVHSISYDTIIWGALLNDYCMHVPKSRADFTTHSILCGRKGEKGRGRERGGERRKSRRHRKSPEKLR